MSALIEPAFDPAKVQTSLNGTDLELAARATAAAVAALQQAENLTGRRVILYAGTFGRANAIPLLLAAAHALAPACPEAVWVFMGHGFYSPSWLLLPGSTPTSGWCRRSPAMRCSAGFGWQRYRWCRFWACRCSTLTPRQALRQPRRGYSGGSDKPGLDPGAGRAARLRLVFAGRCPALARRLGALLAEPGQLRQAGEGAANWRPLNSTAN